MTVIRGRAFMRVIRQGEILWARHKLKPAAPVVAASEPVSPPTAAPTRFHLFKRQTVTAESGSKT